MTTLNEEKFLLVKQYVGLLETIETAFEHMMVCYEELRFEGATELWNDILLAFLQIDSSNSIIADQFAESPSLLQCFTQFEAVLDNVELLDREEDILVIEKMIHKKIYPIFTVWKEQINHELLPYYII